MQKELTFITELDVGHNGTVCIREEALPDEIGATEVELRNSLQTLKQIPEMAFWIQILADNGLSVTGFQMEVDPNIGDLDNFTATIVGNLYYNLWENPSNY